jgi:hypothetical protein
VVSLPNAAPNDLACSVDRADLVLLPVACDAIREIEEPRAEGAEVNCRSKLSKIGDPVSPSSIWTEVQYLFPLL